MRKAPPPPWSHRGPHGCGGASFHEGGRGRVSTSSRATPGFLLSLSLWPPFTEHPSLTLSFIPLVFRLGPPCRSHRGPHLRDRQARCVPLFVASLFIMFLASSHRLTIAFPPTAASEVSSILEQRISGSSAGGDVQETGRVLSECRAARAVLLLIVNVLQPLMSVLPCTTISHRRRYRPCLRPAECSGRGDG